MTLPLLAETDALVPETSVTEGVQALGIFGFGVTTTLVVIGAVLTVLWLLRQRTLLGMPATLLLSVLRCVVIGIAFWMIAQPSWIRTETTSRPAELVVLADGSGSMSTVDPPQTPLNDGWDLAIHQPDEPLAIVQRAELDLRMIGRGAAMQPIGGSQPDWFQAKNNADKALIDRASELLTSVRDSEPTMVDACLSSLNDATKTIQEFRQSDDRSERLAFMASHAEAIQTAIIDMETLRINLQSRHSNSDSRSIRSRKDYVVELLGRFEQAVEQESAGRVSLRRAVFAGQVVPMTAANWTASLDSNLDASDPSRNSGVIGAADQDSRTDVVAALQFAQSLAPTSNLAAVLMLTEGQHNASNRLSPVDVATGLAGTPVFTIVIGNRERKRDVLIHRVNAPAIVFQEDVPMVEAVVSGYGCDGDEVEVTLSQGSTDSQGSEGSSIVEVKRLRFPSDLSDVAVQFRLPRSNVGNKEYSLAVEALDGESILQNNRSAFSIQTIKSKLGLLIADRQPRWEYRYLEQLFRRDNRVDLDKLLLMPTVKSTLSPAAQLGQSSLLPTTVDGWSRFDVAILGDLPPDVLTPEVCDAMSRWVRSGGNVIVVAGKHSMPEAYRNQPWFDLLPIEINPLPVSVAQRPTPTVEGLFHPSIRLDKDVDENRLLWMRWMSGPMPGFVTPFHSAKPSASVFASLAIPSDQETASSDGPGTDGTESGNRAAWLCSHRVGSGRVAFLSSPVSYRLRIRAGDEYHHRFWGQLVRWMTTSDLASGDDLVQIQADRSSYAASQRIGVRVRLTDLSGSPVRNGDVQVELTAQIDRDEGDAETRMVQLIENVANPGAYELSMDPLPAGIYKMNAIGPTIEALRSAAAISGAIPDRSADDNLAVTFTVEAIGNLENIMTEADPMLLKQIAEASGGLSIPPAALEEVLKVVSLAPNVTQSKQVTPLWNRWLNLWIILGCLSTDWWIRRTKGLV